jgi:hypothetical protein
MKDADQTGTRREARSLKKQRSREPKSNTLHSGADTT